MTRGAARRLALASIGLASSLSLLRPFVADALVSRGDEYLRIASLDAAYHYYARALLFDRDCEAAVERLTFTAFELRAPRKLSESTRIAGDFLSRHPGSQAIRVDRALALHAAGDEAAAAREFFRAADALRDARYYVLASFTARRAGDFTAAKRAHARAVELEPRLGARRRRES